MSKVVQKVVQNDDALQSQSCDGIQLFCVKVRVRFIYLYSTLKATWVLTKVLHNRQNMTYHHTKESLIKTDKIHKTSNKHKTHITKSSEGVNKLHISLDKNVLRDDLNSDNVEADLIEIGKVFQNFGAWTEKALSPLVINPDFRTVNNN